MKNKDKDLLFILFLLWKKLSLRRRKQLIILVIIMLFSSLAEVFSLASVVPFLTVLVSPESLWENQLIRNIFINLGVNNQNEILFPITLIFVIASILSAIIRLLNIWLNGKLAAAIGSDLSCEAYKKTLYQPYSEHLISNSSNLISSIAQDVNITIFNVIRPILELFSSILITFSLILTLFLVDFTSAFSTGFIILIVYGLAIKNNSKPLRMASLNIVNLNRTLIKSLQEGLGAIRDIILDGTQELYSDIYSKTDRPLRQFEAKRTFLSYYPRLLLEPLGTSLIAILGFLLVKTGGLASALPTLGVLALGAMRLLPMVQKTYEGWALPQSSKESLINLLDLLNKPMPKEYISNVPVFQLERNIIFNNVSFSYRNDENYVLKRLNLEIKRGEKVGITGETGSGKSTAMDLLMGLIKPTNGEILIDGMNLHSNESPTRLSSWQSSIVHVPQNIFLADSSIAENIAFGVPYNQIDFNRLDIVCKNARIYDFIISCPRKYNTFVGERGIRLSGGQRQRIAIARALYKRISFLILDEATSALDNNTEESIMNNLNSINDELTIIMIAHRLNSLKFCDRTLRLSKGMLLEN